MFDLIINKDQERGTTKKRNTNKHCPELIFHQLSPEQVKQALSSLVSSSTTKIAHRKRGRPKSQHRSVEPEPKKQKSAIYNQLSLSPRTEAPESIVLATSGLTSKQIRQVKKFVLIFNCRLLLLDERTTFHPSITHLITDEVGSEDSLVCTLTKTVLFAIAQHCFILSYRWICQCLQENLLINEELFEIEGDHIFGAKHNGPRRSRLAKQALLPLNHFIMIKGSTGHFLDLTNAELGDLAWLVGGIYIEQNRFPNTIFPRQCYLLIEDADIRNKNMFHRCIDKGLKFLRSEWLIRSVVEYRLASIIQYHCDPFDSIDRSE